MLVLASHSNAFLPDFVAPLALGNVGVFCFFVVSGFVIAEACEVFYPGAPTRFLANRFLKIFPPYWVACAFAVAVYVTGDHPEFRADASAVLANLSIVLAPPGAFMWISVIWAVGIELRFYVLAAAIDLTTRRLAARGVSATLTLGIAAALALGLYVYTTAADFARLATFRHAPFFVLGMAYYFWLVGSSRSAATALLASAPLTAHSYWTYNEAGGGAPIATAAVFATSVALFCILATIRVSSIIERMDKRLGDLSYALYLVHWPIVYAVTELGLSAPAAFLLILAASLAAAAVLVTTIERPILVLRDRIRQRRLYA
jgi:peptidoglycan/LPS O-acetylase OafA/YrhL